MQSIRSFLYDLSPIKNASEFILNGKNNQRRVKTYENKLILEINYYLALQEQVNP